MQKYTINDVANVAAVSKATISRYLNGHFERMSPATRKKIERVISELGYVPNYNASALKSKRSHQIGVVVGDVSNVYSTILFKGISTIFRPRHDQIVIADGGEDPDQEATAINHLLSQNVDGIILQPARSELANYQFLKDSGIPVVLVDRYLSPLPFPCVTSNDLTAGTVLAQKVLAKGYERVLVISNPIAHASVRQERFQAFATACQTAQVPIALLEITNDTDIEKIATWLNESANQKGAIFAGNGNLLMETLRWLQTEQVAIPSAVGLCGYDDWNWAALANPPLSVVNQNPEHIGRAVAERLAKLIDGEAVPLTRTQIPAEIHIRASL